MLILPCTPAMAFPPSFRVRGPIYHELKLQTFSSYKLIVSDVASLWLGTVSKVDVRENSWPCFRVRCCFLIWGAHRTDWTPFSSVWLSRMPRHPLEAEGTTEGWKPHLLVAKRNYGCLWVPADAAGPLCDNESSLLGKWEHFIQCPVVSSGI